MPRVFLRRPYYGKKSQYYDRGWHNMAEGDMPSSALTEKAYEKDFGSKPPPAEPKQAKTLKEVSDENEQADADARAKLEGNSNDNPVAQNNEPTDNDKKTEEPKSSDLLKKKV